MRLIDADLILNDNNQFYYYLTDEWVVRVRDIENAETVDAVPVVRCMDCIWSRHGVSGDLFCFYTGLVKEYYFCSYGERKEE